ncbi:hypothetical protein [Biformimicrobium ophioploci]|uniref:Uncharacterized protein n=1 Tax=Biformimicrobium ophioploci TaxID=3036711 RepID=A0ABQ6LYP5_9GAMM|nr:hypothetical protein [Microbulbifer sp. NKW57]GMG87219.1 hypothetical protein MNKW57_15400 [Microbulbifer sp. NKW57]
MPYKTAHYWLLALIPVTVIAFWPSYFGRLGTANYVHHWHGITGTAWILLLAAQNWLATRKNFNAHKQLGLTLFVLVPLLIGSFALVSHLGAVRFAAGSPFYAQVGMPLLTADILYVFATALLVYLALKFRRNVKLHSALMLSTVIAMISPIFARLLGNYVPGLLVTGLETLYRFEYNVLLSMALAVGITIFLYLRNRKDGWPWLLAGAITLFSYILFWTLGRTDAWKDMMMALSNVSAIAVFAFGTVLGMIACMAGWLAATRQPGAAPAAA